MGRARNPDNDAFYVLNLCDEVFGVKGSREHTFERLLGDLPPKTGRRKALPVDGYGGSLGLVVEVIKSQHFAPTPHFDKPEDITVSGVHRGVQKRLYGQRRRELVSKHGLKLAGPRRAP